ncbi:MAG: hypothetical protein A3B31_02370 [Candidatus Komeilibacteria bacterium RIFCSPLOWO2_01_FULL_53_11]|uniref:Uncharacterized protein n=1 Tax=Candidatus Komeilibacteria bacterium RIFCSPLOWO2_01_FULL_53_11 TaxID=1798552 RepID=A0A1G2BWC3_9BACT|nr:MAG: hypothetical protein A3B31_02370 [Candidatus Komeilibacteria bacterium RIFCSPLOWO2_01_FULL_53_11]
MRYDTVKQTPNESFGRACVAGNCMASDSAGNSVSGYIFSIFILPKSASRSKLMVVTTSIRKRMMINERSI